MSIALGSGSFFPTTGASQTGTYVVKSSFGLDSTSEFEAISQRAPSTNSPQMMAPSSFPATQRIHVNCKLSGWQNNTTSLMHTLHDTHTSQRKKGCASILLRWSDLRSVRCLRLRCHDSTTLFTRIFRPSVTSLWSNVCKFRNSRSTVSMPIWCFRA